MGFFLVRAQYDEVVGVSDHFVATPGHLSDRDFHPTVGAYSQAHFFNRFAVKSDRLRSEAAGLKPLRQSL